MLTVKHLCHLTRLCVVPTMTCEDLYMRFKSNNNTVFQEIETRTFQLFGRFIVFCLKEPNMFSFPTSTRVSAPT